MRILFLVKFYEPFDRGGSEWSTHDLANMLAKMGHDVSILTPNFGTRNSQQVGKINIVRFPFFKKLKDPKSPIAPFWTNNIFWFIYTSLYVSWFIHKNRHEIIHIHSNEFIPAGVIAGKLNNRPTLVTFRDYQSLCNLGFCLWQKDKVCTNLAEYISKDFAFFYQNYVTNKNPLLHLLLLAAAIRGWIMQKIVFYFARQIQFKVAVSEKVSDIFRKNKMPNLQVIHNPVIVNKKPEKSTSNTVVYVGKLSLGKGVDILLDSYMDIQRQLPNLKLKIIGSGVLMEQLLKKVNAHHLSKKVKVLGQLNHIEVLGIVRKAVFVVVPSVWPEPLPRSAIEALLSGTPVVASTKGGIPEVIKGKYGEICKPNRNSLRTAMINVYRKRNILKQNIFKDLSALEKHFSLEASSKYIKIYERALT